MAAIGQLAGLSSRKVGTPFGGLLSQVPTAQLTPAALPAVQAVLSGADVFMLYDTFGFPLEITSEVAEAAGVGVDTAGFAEEMEAQRKRAQDARQEIDLTAKLALGELAEKVRPPHLPGCRRYAPADWLFLGLPAS